MKVAIITDTHFGGRGDNPTLLKHQRKFFKEVFFPTLKKEGIKTILHMGDLFDRRKFINFNSLKLTKDIFLDPMKEYGMEMHIITGNHDVFYKNTNRINSLELLLKEYDNINVYDDDIKELTFDNARIVMVPWLNPENTERILTKLKKSKTDIVLGHFEIVGFVMSGGEKCKHGLGAETFVNFEKVLSGHFHVPSKKTNIQYIGAPYQMDWSDYKGDRGFYIMDCVTKDMEFFKNPFNLFSVIEYDDKDATIEDLEDLDKNLFEDTFIRINPTNVENVALFEKFVQTIENFNAADIKIKENAVIKKEEGSESTPDIDFEIDDTETFISSYVDKMKYDTKLSDAIKTKMNDLYKRSKK